MSCIVYQTDPKTGIKYAYESVSYWDKDKKQPRSKRQYIGRVDEKTGEIIRKKEKAKHSTEPSEGSSTEIRDLLEKIKEQEKTIDALKSEIKTKDEKYRKLTASVRKVKHLVSTELSGL